MRLYTTDSRRDGDHARRQQRVTRRTMLMVSTAVHAVLRELPHWMRARQRPRQNWGSLAAESATDRGRVKTRRFHTASTPSRLMIVPISRR